MDNNKKEKLEKFQILCDNSELFHMVAWVIILSDLLEKGVNELSEKYKWYAQIADCIIKKNTDNINDDEKVKFIDLHFGIVKEIKEKQNIN
jgi:hypothetical protein